MTGSIRNHSPVCATNVERSVTAKLPPALHDRLVELARARGLTKGGFVRELVKEVVAREAQA